MLRGLSCRPERSVTVVSSSQERRFAYSRRAPIVVPHASIHRFVSRCSLRWRLTSVVWPRCHRARTGTGPMLAGAQPAARPVLLISSRDTSLRTQRPYKGRSCPLFQRPHTGALFPPNNRREHPSKRSFLPLILTAHVGIVPCSPRKRPSQCLTATSSLFSTGGRRLLRVRWLPARVYRLPCLTVPALHSCSRS